MHVFLVSGPGGLSGSMSDWWNLERYGVDWEPRQ